MNDQMRNQGRYRTTDALEENMMHELRRSFHQGDVFTIDDGQGDRTKRGGDGAAIPGKDLIMSRLSLEDHAFPK